MLTLPSWLVLLCRRLLLVRPALTAGRTLVLLRWGLLARAALTAGRRLVGTLILLRRGLLARAVLTAGRGLVGTLVLLRRGLLLGRATLARRGRLARALSTTLGADHVRQSEPRDGLIIDAPAGLEALLPLKCHQRLGRPRTQPSVRSPDVEPFLVQHDLHLADLLLSQVQCARSRSGAAQLCSSAAG